MPAFKFQMVKRVIERGHKASAYHLRNKIVFLI